MLKWHTKTNARENESNNVGTENKKDRKTSTTSFTFGMSSLPLSVSCGFYNIKKKRENGSSHKACSLWSLLTSFTLSLPFFSTFLCNFIFLPLDTRFFFCPLQSPWSKKKKGRSNSITRHLQGRKDPHRHEILSGNTRWYKEKNLHDWLSS